MAKNLESRATNRPGSSAAVQPCPTSGWLHSQISCNHHGYKCGMRKMAMVLHGHHGITAPVFRRQFFHGFPCGFFVLHMSSLHPWLWPFAPAPLDGDTGLASSPPPEVSRGNFTVESDREVVVRLSALERPKGLKGPKGRMRRYPGSVA